MIIAADNRTFAQRVDDAMHAARAEAAPFAPSRAQIEDKLRPIAEELELMDEPYAFIRETFRPGHWDAVALGMFVKARAGR